MISIRNETGEVVADIFGETLEEAKERSRLYEAAPDLLESLKAMTSRMRDQYGSEALPVGKAREMLLSAERAIAKATGEK